MENNKRLYFITEASVNGIGGAQLYLVRRIKYLKEKNDVIIITGDCKSIVLPELKKVKILEYNFLNLNKQDISLNKKYTKIIIKELEMVIREYKEVYFECHDYELWFEKICSFLKINYIIYMLLELPLFQDRNLNFYLEKLRRKELIGISKEALKISLGKYYEEKYNEYVNIGFDPKDIKSNLIKVKELGLEKKDEIFRIIIVSRLEKEYVEKAIEEIYKLSEEEVNLNIELVIVGDSKDGKEKIRLENKYFSSRNLKIKFFGYINPLFAELYLNSDLFIGMGTALINAASFGCISLGIDPRNNEASGFLGIDLFSFGYSSNGVTYKIKNRVKEYIYLSNEEKKNYKIKTKDFFYKEYNFEITMKKLDYYIFKKDKNFECIKIKLDVKSILKNYLKKVLFLLKIEKYIRKIFKTKKLFHI